MKKLTEMETKLYIFILLKIVVSITFIYILTETVREPLFMRLIMLVLQLKYENVSNKS